jgi:hypothetical protein
MNSFDSPFDRDGFHIESVLIFGESPDGNWIVDIEDLPFLPIPNCVMITKDILAIDGWVFPLVYVTKSFLIWLHHTVLRWAQEDDSETNKQWLDGIVDALMDALTGNL